MKQKNLISAGVIFALIFEIGCATCRPHSDKISQFSLMNALSQGLYEADFDYAEIKRYGDFGLGTFDGLSGEMVAVDGNFYQVKYDGSVSPVTDSQKCPFCVVKFFKADKTFFSEEKMDYARLCRWLDSIITSKNIFYAVRIEGNFSYLKARSVPKQERPYKNLNEALKEQEVFEFKDVNGTLVGFKFPGYAEEINTTGWHFHFISKDKSKGGHLVDCLTGKVDISLDETNDFFLKVPGNREFLKMKFNNGIKQEAASSE